ncbi:hypothetical protein MN608_04393 [Microdochium nivale]|nr:hypothetical protein MN608_04393 [Microdochium nivale]
MGCELAAVSGKTQKPETPTRSVRLRFLSMPSQCLLSAFSAQGRSSLVKDCLCLLFLLCLGVACGWRLEAEHNLQCASKGWGPRSTTVNNTRRHGLATAHTCTSGCDPTSSLGSQPSGSIYPYSTAAMDADTTS